MSAFDQFLDGLEGDAPSSAQDKPADFSGFLDGLDAPAPSKRDFDAKFNTVLTPDEEGAFQKWKTQHAPNDSGQDYDLRGAFKAGVTPAGAEAGPDEGHFPDTYKKPNHPTFSNESRYAKYGTPGRWEGRKFVPATQARDPLLEDAAKNTLQDVDERIRDVGRGAINILDWPMRASTGAVLAGIETATDPNRSWSKDFPEALSTFTEAGHAPYKGPKDLPLDYGVSAGELPEWLIGKVFEKGGEIIHDATEKQFERGMLTPSGAAVTETVGNALMFLAPMAAGRGKGAEKVVPKEPPPAERARAAEAAPSMARLNEQKDMFEVRQPVEAQAGPAQGIPGEFSRFMDGLEARPSRDTLREIERKAIEEDRPEEALQAARERIEPEAPASEWALPRDEYVRRYIEAAEPQERGVLKRALEEDHRRMVGEALDRGERLPEVVKAEYPDLARSRPEAQERVAPPVESGVFDQFKLPEDQAPVAAGPVAMTPGGNYRGMIDDSKQVPPGPGARAAEKPIRREDILQPFLQALGVPLYQGRIKGRGTLGLYWPGKETVRIKKRNDIEVAAHELAHYIDDKVFHGFGGGGQRPWLPGGKNPQYKVFAAELKGLSYDAKKVSEGFAEYVRHWMTDPQFAAVKAPEFTKWWEKFVATHKWGPAIREAQKGMTKWFAQDALSRAKSKIGAARDVNEGVNSIFSRFRQEVFDDLEGIRRMEQSLTGKLQSVGPYETARLTRAAYSMVEGTLTIGRLKRMPDGSFKFEGKGLKHILDDVGRDLDSWLLYAVGRSARELKGQGRENLFTEGEIKAMESLESPDGRFARAFHDYQEWNKSIVDFAQQMGIINPETRALWKRTQYMPFYRVEKGSPGRARVGGVEGDWNGIKKLTGGTENIRDVLGNMIQNSARLITEGLRNEARVKIANMADQVRGGGRFMQKIARDNKKISVDREQIIARLYETFGLSKKMVDMGIVPPGAEPIVRMIEHIASKNPEYMEFWMRGVAPKGDNLVAVMRGGKADYYEVADPLVYRAFGALNRPTANWLVQFLNTSRRLIQGTITLAPDFMAANLARDTLMGAVMSRHGFKPFVDSVRGMKNRLTKDATYKEFVANGGGFSSYLVDEKAFRTHLERFYTKKGIDYKTVADTPAKALYFLETLTDAFEMSTRLGEFRQARAKGEHARHAAYSAREVSTDFAMRGDSQVLGFFYDSVIFLKAAMNGMDRLYRGVAHDPNKGAIMVKTGMIATISAALYMLNRDNPAYQDLEDWDRDSHWHFFVPQGNGEKVHFRYPKIWEIGAVASIAERSLEHLLDGEWKRYAKEVGKILQNIFKFEYIPAVLAPAYEIAINKNRFTDRPIQTIEMERLEPFARSSPYTSPSVDALGLASRDMPIQINPAVTEALIRGYFNTYGLYGLSMADAAFFDNAPEKRLDQYPVIRRFYSQEPPRHTKYEKEFYEMLREATQLRLTMRAMETRGQSGIAEELLDKPQTGAAHQLETVNKRIQVLTREIQEAYRSPNLPPAGKRKLIDEKVAERNQLYKDVVTEVRPMMK